MGFNLQQEQVQKLVMTPELRQAITILQFSAQDLLSYIENEMQSNPVMEWAEQESTETAETAGQWDWTSISRLQRPIPSESMRAYSEETKSLLEGQTKFGITLADHLFEQLVFVRCESGFRRLCQYIIYSLDENGYLKIPDEELADLCGTTVEQIREAIDLVQTFEPAGVAARSLQECLLIQVRQLDIDASTESSLECLIEDHLRDVAEGKWNKLIQTLHLSPQQLQQLTDLLKSLDPKPGRAFSDCRPPYVIPDVAVEKVSDQYVVIVNDRLAPHLCISETYRKLLNTPDGSEAKEFIHRKLTSALSLIKSIEQRRMTLYNVTKAIVDIQQEFFEYGISHLKPLTMRQVADVVGVHESTVSRATHDKYVQTPRGIFELKFFFTSGIKMQNGLGNSAESIKAQIKDIIDREDPCKPMSDQKIADVLAGQGVPISRRTVTKYREEMGVLATAQRKRLL
ncbi:RNA polymerase factor sigma-54 [Fodinisporobacter ferrooxydans]|uniref:RNA polymerase factor sigma-54 n=1 Tax=Fodinisporobacter ferrooxydans TaxID=2901836 RepID=A0ABY4CL72_9BACL|nr:RNA polymerase factor sigma-54 [Alicyclobacillaceae bacterium MYW30-H2]